MRYVVSNEGEAFALNDDGTWSTAPSTGSALELLNANPVPTGVVSAVRGSFGSLGMRVVETGETLTCTHRGDAIAFAPGVDDASIDFVIPMHLYQVRRLVGFFEDGVLDDLELFYVTRALFATGAGQRHLLGNPLVANPILRKLIGGKNLLHITLISPRPAAERDALFTMAFVAGQWLVVPGLHGRPERVFKVPVADAMELQRLLYTGMVAGIGELGTWMKIARDYVRWRERVEVPVPATPLAGN
jgi:hypothetical protein